MLISAISLGRRVALGCLLGGLAGCTSAGNKTTPVVSQPRADAPTAAKSESKPSDDAADKLEEFEIAETKNTRKLAKLERDLNIASERLAKSRMSEAHAAIAQKVAVAKAGREFELEAQRSKTFRERAVPNRLAWAELRLAQAQDRVKDAEEELHQLGLMYAEEHFADQTKEIVLQRSRRRLERSHRDLELRVEDHAILTEKTIPLELTEHEQKVEQKERTLENARRDAESSKLDKRIAVMSAESDVVRVGVELKSIEEEMERARSKHEKEMSETNE